MTLLSHFWAESNVVNFVIANSRKKTAPLGLYPILHGLFVERLHEHLVRLRRRLEAAA